MHGLDFSRFLPGEFTPLAIVILAPLFGAFFNGVFGKRVGKNGVRLISLFAIGVSFLTAVYTFFALKHEIAAHGEEGPPTKLAWLAWKWLDMAKEQSLYRLGVDVRFSVDQLSGVMMLVITGVGFLIHLYSTSYMAKDASYHRFFAYLNLFVFSMLVLVLADNMPLMFVGWEGVGACSYLLIGFWFDKTANAAAGRKAFIANRVGDVGIIGGMLMIAHITGALDWDGIRSGIERQVPLSTKEIAPAVLERVTIASDFAKYVGYGMGGLALVLALVAGTLSPKWKLSRLIVGGLAVVLFLGGVAVIYRVHGPAVPISVSVATIACLSLFLGCTGKSAQIPLYVWLPDAMAGPTPVSALIHAATMVTSGIYLCCRLNFLFVWSPMAMMVIAIIGALTALFAATIALVQNDIKKVLAYSTVSQLGFMFLGVGVGAFDYGFFHVFTHAFFKACLFLGAGSVIHAMHKRIHDDTKSQDMRNMGGLRRYMPWTFYSMAAATVAISGLPLTSGFFSKDGILFHAAANRVVHPRKATAELVAKLHPKEAAAELTKYFEAPAWLGTALFVVGVLAATMTAFYMFRLLFRTFWGDFRGWSVAPHTEAPNPLANEEPLVDDVDPHADLAAVDAGHDLDAAHDPAHDAHADHGHDHHEEDLTEPGDAPAEAPWTMAVPVAILGALAIVAGFFYAEPLHIEPLGRFLEPIFHDVMQHVDKAGLRAGSILERETAKKLELALMIPGILAFAVGSSLAWLWYVKGEGKKPAELAAKYPALYTAALNKWYVDELYDATIIGGTDALADGAAFMDVWLVDGILAKLTTFIASGLGSLLRRIQTGVVHVYAAILAIGTLAVGVFFWQPHADYNLVKDGEDKFTVEAAPGLGYEYKWTLDDGKAEGAFTSGDSALKRTVVVKRGERKTLTFEVKNAFGRTQSTTVTIDNPSPPPASSAGAQPKG